MKPKKLYKEAIILNRIGETVNEYGHDEGYHYKEIRSYLSGHLCRGSAIETDDSCGNCDGGRCDICKEKFEVYLFGEPIDVMTDYGWTERILPTVEHKVFDDLEKALEYYNTL